MRAVLSVIPKDREGQRDFALLAALLVTGLRVGQVRTWKRSKIRCSGGSARIRNWNLPKVVCEALQAANKPYGDTRFNNIPLPFTLEDTYVFTASKCRGQNRDDTFCHEPIDKPLSPQEINRRIGRYARLAW